MFSNCQYRKCILYGRCGVQNTCDRQLRRLWPVLSLLQRCPLHKATREDMWPVSTSLTTKLYGCKQELEMLLVGCLTSQQHASVSQGRICSDNFTYCHPDTQVADQTFHLTQSQYTDTGPTSPSADSITPGAWQGSHWSANF